MKSRLLALLLLLSPLCSTAQTPQLDIYGGIEGTSVPGCGSGNGFFQVKKVGAQWIFCDPIGHAFWLTSVQVVVANGSNDTGDSTYGTNHDARTITIYGGRKQWTNEIMRKLRYWGFNATSAFGINKTAQWNTDLPSNPYPMPAMIEGTDNDSLVCRHQYCPSPVKDMQQIQNQSVITLSTSQGAPDPYDPSFDTYVNTAAFVTTLDSFYSQYYTSPWAFAFISDDADTWQGIGPGKWNDATLDSTDGVVAVHQGALSLEAPPLLATASQKDSSGNVQFVTFTDTQEYSKTKALAFLCGGAGLYTTIGALNTAWGGGANYTSCGSTGTVLNGVSFTSGSGVGPYTATLSTTVSKHSIVIHAAQSVLSVSAPGVPGASRASTGIITFTTTASHGLSAGQSGVVVAGVTDNSFNGTYAVSTVPSGTTFTVQTANATVATSGNGTVTPSTILGGDWPGDSTIRGFGIASGTINYATGALSVTFNATPTTPTFDYVQNGWGIGTGLSDEDGRHTGWLGTADGTLVGSTAQVFTDLSALQLPWWQKAFSTIRTRLKQYAPNILLLSPNPLNGHGGLSRKEVLQAAGQYFDVLQSGVRTQNMLDKMNLYAGDVPITIWEGYCANADSFMFGSSPTCDTSLGHLQSNRATKYTNNLEFYRTGTVTGGCCKPIIGIHWWRLDDDWGAGQNWGLVSLLDNPYDGRCAVTAVSTDPYGFPCGKEGGNWGDFIDSIRTENLLIQNSMQTIFAHSTTASGRFP